MGEGAVATVYVAGDGCQQARRALEDAGGRAGSLRLRVVCLPAVERHGRLDLAQIGANARRATEDSTTIAYLDSPQGTATRFAASLLEEAGIAQLTNRSGTAAMRQLLGALYEASDSESPRAAVYESLESD